MGLFVFHLLDKSVHISFLFVSICTTSGKSMYVHKVMEVENIIIARNENEIQFPVYSVTYFWIQLYNLGDR